MIPSNPPIPDSSEASFPSKVVDRVRSNGGVWKLPGGELRLPGVFGFCRGVKRAIAMASEALSEHSTRRGRLVLLGEIIHNPWVNDFFSTGGVSILTGEQLRNIEDHVGPEDCALIPAFGVPEGIRKALERIACRVVDCTCGDVLRLWRWSCQAARDGFAVVIFGRANHDETLVTISRLVEAGGTYLVLQTLEEVDRFAEIFASGDEGAFSETFAATTNASSLEPFERLAQVSQTTMLYDETLSVRRRLGLALTQRFGPDAESDRLRFEPTVCQATQ